MSTGTRTAYGIYTHGTPRRTGRSYHRLDTWESNRRPGESELVRVFCAGGDDDSPAYTGPYEGACSCCWLGFVHTWKRHARIYSKEGEVSL